MWEHDYRDFKKRKFSASTDGRGIKVAATASPGTLIHQALASIAGQECDEIWLRATNTSASAVQLTVQFGGTTAPDDSIILTLQPQVGLVDVVLGHILQNGAQVKAFAATANVIVLHGFVHRYQNTQ